MSDLVPPSGPQSADVLLFGKAPGREECSANRPFVGKAGREHRAYCARFNLHPHQFRTTNLCRTFIEPNEPLTREQVDYWTPDLLAEISLTKPRLIVPVGAAPVKLLLGPAADLNTVHGIPHKPGTFGSTPASQALSTLLPDVCILPLIQPAAGFHNPDSRALINWDYSQLAQVYTLIRTSSAIDYRHDPYAGREVYRDVTGNELRRELLFFSEHIPPLIGLDTEGEFSLQVCIEPGVAFLLRSDQPDFHVGIEALQYCADHGSVFTGHNIGMYDLEVLRWFKLDLFHAAIRDTLFRAFLFCIEPLGLKPNSWRTLGMRMKSHKETVGALSKQFQIDYLAQVVEHTRNWPKPDPQFEIDNAGVCKVKRPNSIASRAQAILLDIDKEQQHYDEHGDLTSDEDEEPDDSTETGTRKKGAPTDPFLRWRMVKRDLRELARRVEHEIGPMPVGTMRRLYEKDPDAAIEYACLDARSCVLTTDGREYIGEIVNNKLTPTVVCYDLANRKLTTSRVTGWYKIKAGRGGHHNVKWMSIRTDLSRGGRWGFKSISRYTPEHRVLTARGWVQVQDLTAGDELVYPVDKLSNNQLQLALGSGLGDGSIAQRHDGGWPSLVFSNGEKQSRYVQWKQKILGGLYGGDSSYTSTSSKKVGATQFAVWSVAHPELLSISKKSKLVDRADEIEALGLAIWYQDDGCKVGNSGRLYTLDFSAVDVDRLREVLLYKFGVETTRCCVSGRSQWFIHIRVRSASRFFSLIGPHIHPQLQYKIPEAFRQACVIPKDSPRGVMTAKVLEVFENPSTGSCTRFCIDVEDHHNFVTLGGEIAHNCKDSDASLRLDQPFSARLEAEGKTALAETYEINVRVFSEMQENGMPVSRHALEQLRERMTGEMLKLSAQIAHTYNDGLPFNPASNPQCVAVLERLGLRGLKRTKKGGMSASKPSIQHLKFIPEKATPEERYKREFAVLLFKWREHQLAQKFCTSTLDTLPDSDLDECTVRAQLLPWGIPTRRMRSKNPNLLAQPKHSIQGQMIRNCYVAPEGYVFLECDLASGEVCVMAHESGDPDLIRIMTEGVKIHRETAMRLFDIPREQVNDVQYLVGKRTIFGTFFGQTGTGLKEQLWMQNLTQFDDDACQDFIDKLKYKVYPGIGRYEQRVAAELRGTSTHPNLDGSIRDMSGMERKLPGIHSDDRGVANEAVRHGVSQKIQGGQQALIQNAIAWLKDQVRELQSWVDVKWRLTIHDSLLLTCPEWAVEIVKVLIEEGLTQHCGYKLRVPIRAETKVAKTWGGIK